MGVFLWGKPFDKKVFPTPFSKWAQPTPINLPIVSCRSSSCNNTARIGSKILICLIIFCQNFLKKYDLIRFLYVLSPYGVFQPKSPSSRIRARSDKPRMLFSVGRGFASRRSLLEIAVSAKTICYEKPNTNKKQIHVDFKLKRCYNILNTIL